MFEEKILEHKHGHYVVPDSLFISEDMAYKAKSMISMDMARTFCMPSWRAWTQQVTAAGCPIVDVDSDGFIGELIPLWIESGLRSRYSARCLVAELPGLLPSAGRDHRLVVGRWAYWG